MNDQRFPEFLQQFLNQLHQATEAPAPAAAAAAPAPTNNNNSSSNNNNNTNAAAQNNNATNNNNNNNSGFFFFPHPTMMGFFGDAFPFGFGSDGSSSGGGGGGGFSPYDMAAAMAASMQQQQTQQQRQAAPPASAAAIRQLPIIQVCPQDLIEECNRHCSICLSEIQLNDRVVRLPCCAHLFCRDCIVPWLSQQSCTCPVCRYEFPTDDPVFEQTRPQRMQHRKPRFLQHELQRMTVKQLLQLVPQQQQQQPQQNQQQPREQEQQQPPLPRFVDKSELIDYLVQGGHIQVVPAPEPYGQFTLQQLHNMSISQLKQTCEHAGVFYYKQDVVEKSDLVHLLMNSGRIGVVWETEEDVDDDDCMKVEHCPTDNEILVETVLEGDDDDSDDDDDNKNGTASRDRRTDRSLVMEEDHYYEQDNNDNDRKPAARDAVRTQERVRVATPSSASSSSSSSSSSDDYSSGSHTTASSSSSSTSTTSSSSSRRKRSRRERDTEMLTEDEAPASATLPTVNEEAPYSATYDDNSNNNHRKNNYYSNHSIPELRSLALEHNVDLTGCLEKNDILERLSSCSSVSDMTGTAMAAAATTTTPNDQATSSTNHHASTAAAAAAAATTTSTTTATTTTTVNDDPLSGWGISEIRALAALSDVDLSACRSRHQMVETLKSTALVRPHVAQYFQTLQPLACLTVSQLRAVARERQISVSDCLEKGDIIQRIVRRSGA